MNKEILLDNINKIHTTPMGIDRIKKNTLIKGDAVEYIKSVLPYSIIYRKGKNYYCYYKNYLFTINAYSYTIITARKIKEKIIISDSILLKSIDDESIDNLYNIITNEDIKKTYMIDNFLTKEEALKYAYYLQTLTYMENMLVYGIYEEKVLVGLINEVSKKDKEIEVGYCILPCYQNKGIATKALQSLIDFLFVSGYEKVKTSVFEENIASKKVMEKCHMVEINYVQEINHQGVTKKCINYEIVKRF